MSVARFYRNIPISWRLETLGALMPVQRHPWQDAGMSDPPAGDASAVRLAVGWVIVVAVASALLAALEVVLVLATVAFASSSVLDVVGLFVDSWRLFAIGGTALALVAAGVERFTGTVNLPRGELWFAAVLASAVTFGVVVASDGYVAGLNFEFDHATSAVRGLVAAASVMTSVVVVALFVPGLVDRLHGEHWWPQARAWSIATWSLLSIATVAFAHALLAPVYSLHLSGFAGLVGWTAAALAVRAGLESATVKHARAAALVVAALLLSFPVSSSGVARFVLYGHAPVAGAWAVWLRDAVDIDGDGSSSRWIGGNDCAEGDPSIGPAVRETAGDGIDQDCRGGDASEAEVAAVRGKLWEGCALPEGRFHVILLTVDALRFDVLGGRHSPHLNALARRSLVFDRAYVASPLTTTSMSSLFSGRPLSALGDPNPITNERLDVSPTLAERFAAAGYRTHGFNFFGLPPQTTAGFEQRNPGAWDLHPRGIKHQLVAARVVDGLIHALMGRASKPSFAWAHLPDLHAPYVYQLAEGRPDAFAAYLQGVEHVDAQIGRLVQALDRSGALQRTLVAITADHGEQLGQRGREGHGPLLFEESVRVPLVLHVPGCPHRVIASPVSLEWLGATLARLANVEASGRTLLSESTDHLPVVVEEAPTMGNAFKRAIFDGNYKLVVDAQNGGRLLFDLAADHDETTDVARDRPEALERVEAAYGRWLDALPARTPRR